MNIMSYERKHKKNSNQWFFLKKTEILVFKTKSFKIYERKLKINFLTYKNSKSTSKSFNVSLSVPMST